jgi:hypothetical protein
MFVAPCAYISVWAVSSRLQCVAVQALVTVSFVQQSIAVIGCVELDSLVGVWLCCDATFNPVIELNTVHFIPALHIEASHNPLYTASTNKPGKLEHPP